MRQNVGFLAPKLASKADIPCAGFTKYSLLLCVLLHSVFENVKLIQLLPQHDYFWTAFTGNGY